MTLLSEIKERHNSRLELSDEDIKMLIEQAEKVEKIREEIRGKWSTEAVFVNRLHQLLDN